jgi:HlyD family secretion protein
MPPVRRRKSPWVFLLPLLLVGGGVGAWLWTRAQTGRTDEVPTWVVRRGPLRITVTEGGSLQSLNPTTVASSVKGETKIVAVVAEGTQITPADVAAGRVLVELDRSNLEKDRQRQVVTVSASGAELARAQEALKIQENQNESDLRKAALAVEFARIDLQKYVGSALATTLEERAAEADALDLKALASDAALGGEALQERRKRESEIDLAKEEVTRATDKLRWTDDLLSKGYVSKDERAADDLALKRQNVAFEQATTALSIFLTYEFGKQVRTLVSNLRESKDEVLRAKRRADSEVTSKRAEAKGKEDKLRLDEEELARIDGEIQSTTIRARNPGLVVYASSEDRGNWMGDEKPIQPGATIRERQPILSIPDPKSLGVRVNVHESALSKVKPGMRASVVVDAFPDKVLAGRVEKMATLPNSSNRWQNPDLKLYATDIVIEDPPDRVRPGMSARVEILVAEIESTLYVPAQAVAMHAGKPSVWRREAGVATPTAVRVGASNDRYVEVLDGVAEGDVVLLAPPRSPAQAGEADGTKAPGGRDGRPGRGPRGGAAPAPGAPQGPPPSTDASPSGAPAGTPSPSSSRVPPAGPRAPREGAAPPSPAPAPPSSPDRAQ